MRIFQIKVLFPCLILFCLFHSVSVFGQTENEASETERNQTIAIGIGHTQVLKGFKNGSEKWLSLPSWALDYNYRICEKWAIGLQNEIILSDFEVESNGREKTIERSTPFSSTLAITFYPLECLGIFLASGGEFAKEENFVLLRLGIEPSIEVNESLEVLASVLYDYKIEGYDSFGISIGLGYKF